MACRASVGTARPEELEQPVPIRPTDTIAARRAVLHPRSEVVLVAPGL